MRGAWMRGGWMRGRWMLIGGRVVYFCTSLYGAFWNTPLHFYFFFFRSVLSSGGSPYLAMHI